MSIPYGLTDFHPDMSRAAQMRAFDQAVADYAAARTRATTVGVEISTLGSVETPADMRQRLVDASQELFTAGEVLKAYALVLAGGGLIARSASLLEADEAGVI